MGLVFGLDEAGYGPNLGPLVITVTAWEVPGDPAAFDFWSALDAVISQVPPGAADSRRRLADANRPPAAPAKQSAQPCLHVADSKQVYSPGRGLASLERSVLSLLAGASITHATLAELWRHLCDLPDGECGEPWFGDEGLEFILPCAADREEILAFADRVRTAMSDAGISLRSVRSDIVLTRRFNRLTATLGSKGALLSRATLQLLRSVWNPEADGRALVIADKHGGRNHYQALLADVVECLPLCLNEGREHSRYRVVQAELRFEARAERHFPVAVSSMISKYVRELSMEVFNRFWQSHVPDVRPTKGYPGDARRFHGDVAQAQRRLGIPDAVLWRDR